VLPFLIFTKDIKFISCFKILDVFFRANFICGLQEFALDDLDMVGDTIRSYCTSQDHVMSQP
jgi:hypothetical protein